MENTKSTNIKGGEEKEEKKEVVTKEVAKDTSKQQMTTPMAIIVAGFLIMLGIIVSRGMLMSEKSKTLSEQVGLSKDKLTECISNTDTTTLAQNIETSVEATMKEVPSNEMGTPYSVIVGKNGVKTEIKGNDSLEDIKKLIDEVNSGTVTSEYKGEVPDVNENDHIMGSADAPIVIIEYSDYECSYCKKLHATLEQIVKESDGQVAWVFRSWPIHQNSFLKLVAAECVAKLKGNDAFWEYSDLLFGMLKTTTETVTDQL